MVKRKYRDARRRRKIPWYEQAWRDYRPRHAQQWAQIEKKIEAETWDPRDTMEAEDQQQAIKEWEKWNEQHKR
ncbi:MAG TPA: hypothetical protein VFF11_04715 [Candidatus Binatia bacterium]|nr:hypothetical protein [Candidatus Binatia bacterium]